MIVALTVLIGTVMACGSDADAPSNTGEVAETGKIVKIFFSLKYYYLDIIHLIIHGTSFLKIS